MWNISGSVRQGNLHQYRQIPCQDQISSLEQNDVHVIALADGASSASHSKWGAEFVTKKTCDLLVEKFDCYIHSQDGVWVKQDILNTLLNGLENLTQALQCSVKQCASTLLAVAVKENRFMAIHIGDGVIGWIKNNEIKVLSEPDNGEFANTTYFVTSSHAMHFLRLYKGTLRQVDGFVLMSDGTQTSLYNRRTTKLKMEVAQLLEWNSSFTRAEMQETLEYLMNEIIVPGTDDDCSIILMSERLPYTQLDGKAKWECHQLDGSYCFVRNKKKLKKYDKIINLCMEKPNCILEMSRKMHIDKKYLKKDILHLVECGLLQVVNENQFIHKKHGFI